MKNKFTIPVELNSAIIDIIWMARRYAEGRKTYAPGMFNDAYKILKKYVYIDEKVDPDNRIVKEKIK